MRRVRGKAVPPVGLVRRKQEIHGLALWLAQVHGLQRERPCSVLQLPLLRRIRYRLPVYSRELSSVCLFALRGLVGDLGCAASDRVTPLDLTLALQLARGLHVVTE